MRKLLAIILLAYSFQNYAQSIDGIYIGEIIGTKNALILTTVGNSAIGYVQLNETDKISFLGTVNMNKIQGRLNLQSNVELLLLGEVRKDSILINLVFPIDSTRVVKHTLFKYSDNPKTSLTKVFGRNKPQHDPLLFGKWMFIKEVYINGKTDVNDKHTVEYLPDGREIVEGPKLDKMRNELRALGAPPVELRIRWQTREMTVITSSENPSVFGKVDLIQSYIVKDDTLVLTNSKGSKSYFYKEKIKSSKKK